MAKSDEGEFELILGNRQLISVFLIVVVLLGVFFSMGYIVGRNSSAPTADAHNTSKPVPVEPPASEPTAPSTTAAPPAQEPAASPLDTLPPPTGTTHPAQSAEAKPAPEKPAPTRSTASVKPSPVAPAKPKPAADGLATVTHEPSPGQYWQVVATSRAAAEVISEALTRKGFHTLLTPASKEGVFRVLVGPFKDAGTQAEARTKLEASGFKNSIVKRY